MGGKLGRKFAVVIVALSAAATFAVVAQPSGAVDNSNFLKFNYRIDATTHLQKLNQTIVVKNGTFAGYVDFTQAGPESLLPLKGNISLPQTSFTYRAAGILPLIHATAKIAQTKSVVGTLDLLSLTVTATATFTIRIVNAYATGSTINLVGDNCKTSTPVTVTMSGPATFGTPATFSGTFTIPNLANCGLGTTALNLVIPGPGNTFTAVATPK